MGTPCAACDFRYTNFVEVICPLIRIVAMRAILVYCSHCLHEFSSWGLNSVWCRHVSSMLQLADYQTSCALVDATPIQHLDFKSLKGKYDQRGSLSRSFLARGNQDKQDVRRYHAREYINGTRTFRCIGRGDMSQNATFLCPFFHGRPRPA